MKTNYINSLQTVDDFIQQKYPNQEFYWRLTPDKKFEYGFYNETEQISVVCGFTCDSYNTVGFYIHEKCYAFGKQQYNIYFWDMFQQMKLYTEFEAEFNKRNPSFPISWAFEFYKMERTK